MKSAPIRIPIAVRPRFPDRISNDEISALQAVALHPALNVLTDPLSRKAQSDAAHALVRGTVLYVWVTVDENGKVELEAAP